MKSADRGHDVNSNLSNFYEQMRSNCLLLKFFLVFSANSSFGLIKQEHLRWHLPHAIITCDHLTMECYLIIFLVLPDQLTKYPGTRNLLYVNNN